MLFVPLPFVVALLLLLLFLAVVRRDDELAANRPFLILLLVCALQSVFVGLRWGYGLQAVGHLTLAFATIMPPLVYAGVRRLGADTRRRWPVLLTFYSLPAVIIALLVVVWPEAIDIGLILIYMAYALALLWLVRSGPDVLRLAPFEAAQPAHRALVFAAFALCFSAMVDALVLFDFESNHGAHAGMIVSIANLLGLFILGIAAAAASRNSTPAETLESAPQYDPAEDKDTIAKIHELMQEKRLYRDANLNLERLARRAGIPSRRISTAINRIMAKNVSQYVNDYRIAEACRLLAETDRSVTEIMLEAGFQTKSNFNREFRRVTDMTPVAWREKCACPVSPA
ncbi:AraC family transcriptional regulator (plasmid) [Rhizobium sp. CB3090]|uniref:helix-turn-helix domain-containing protein n=1 Tax=Rhizobium sp. CB3090 TaxID=3039156 RepID=UPI0024B0B5A1|nr:AraC family transcriptional regulator [Rhizobium sp. CB3090]WFU11339.1 AraC family transcriptional regulator [Rhizobium sp. CB3090]